MEGPVVGILISGEGPSEAKALHHFDAFAARLKSCPFKEAANQVAAARWVPLTFGLKTL
jgi:hypothetical protein